jgi:hypothetical protein
VGGRHPPRAPVLVPAGLPARLRLAGVDHHVHVIESGWLDRVRACQLFAYRLPAGAFSPHDEVGGYWVAEQPVEAVERLTVDDLLARHAAAGIELRITPSVWPFWERVTASTVEFSGCRLRNATDHPERRALSVVPAATQKPWGRYRAVSSGAAG